MSSLLSGFTRHQSKSKWIVASMQRALPPANSIVGRFKGTILICRVNAARCASLNVGTARGGHHQHEQLENIDPFNRIAPEVLALRVDIYGGLKNGL